MIKKWDLILLAALLLIAGVLAFFLFRGEGAELVAECDGEVLMRVRMRDILEPRQFTFETENGIVTVGISQRGAWIESSNCPNQHCVRSGMISRSGQSVVCLPMHFCIYFTGEGIGEPDGITG